MTPRPMMTDRELELLAKYLKPNMRVWEWGAGMSSLWIASQVKQLTSVEHQYRWAAWLMLGARENQSVLYVPPDRPYAEGTEDDGSLDDFRSYVEVYNGRAIDVVLIDGRARVAAAQFVAERAPFGPHPGTKVILHDCDRESYRSIYELYFKEIERVDNLMVMEPRLGDFVARPAFDADKTAEQSAEELREALAATAGRRT